MKINGITPEKGNCETIVIPRTAGEDIVFLAKAVSSFDRFDELCPEPLPPMITYAKTGEKKKDFKNEDYMERIKYYSEQRMAWLVIESIKHTPGLEWSTVDLDDPETWQGYKKELDACLTPIEQGYLLSGVMDANNLNENKIEEARQRFILSQPDRQ